MIRTTILAALLLAVPACPPSPTPPSPVGDAAPPVVLDGGSICAIACANLAGLGCKEGLAPNCTPTCEHAQDSHITDLHPACLSLAKSKAEAKACGSVVCP